MTIEETSGRVSRDGQQVTQLLDCDMMMMMIQIKTKSSMLLRRKANLPTPQVFMGRFGQVAHTLRHDTDGSVCHLHASAA
jgi:hypothetical protein